MKTFLGVERYGTSPLAPKVTIEHLDTFGKLVTPDTWVFSEFPEGSRFRKDSEAYVALLKTLESPYGTPYRILRLPMRQRPDTLPYADAIEDYRAYINSFISNRALYFPTYGDELDESARRIYAEALPGYEIVGVDAQGTSWGDSVHCRSRNLLRKNTLFLFPQVSGRKLRVEAWPSPGNPLSGAPQVHVTVGHGTERVIPMEPAGEREFLLTLPERERLRLWIEAGDESGKVKTSPPVAIEIPEAP